VTIHDEVHWLLSAHAVRQAAEKVYAHVARGGSRHFDVDERRLSGVVELVAEVAVEAYPDLSTIPYHSRLGHFDAGGVQRWQAFQQRCVSLPSAQRLRSAFDLTIVSVLLDAGAGPEWRYLDTETQQTYRRSEGLAVASYDWFVAGGLSNSATEPLRADGTRLLATTDADLARAFRVTDDNPLLGVSGRASLLRRLGAATQHSALFGRCDDSPRPGNLANAIVAAAAGNEPADSEGVTIHAHSVLELVLEGLGSVWPGRETLDGVNLGDVWTHSELGRVPFHKLSQWLSYSLCDCLEQAGYTVVELDALTGLAEYRNGGLFIDLGVIVPKYERVTSETHPVSSDLVIEWRALTVALLDRTAARLRERWKMTAATLPLAKVLQAGTWAAGRRAAIERRPDGSPPLMIQSDGTVF
jgi:hypothetical protein